MIPDCGISLSSADYESYMGPAFNEELPKLVRIKNVNAPKLRSIFYSGSNNIKVLNKKKYKTVFNKGYKHLEVQCNVPCYFFENNIESIKI